MRFRASHDGGRTWATSVRVSEVSTLFTEDLLRKVPEEEERVGHTAGMAADARGVFHPLWIDNRTGVRQVWTAAVSVSSK